MSFIVANTVNGMTELTAVPSLSLKRTSVFRFAAGGGKGESGPMRSAPRRTPQEPEEKVMRALILSRTLAAFGAAVMSAVVVAPYEVAAAIRAALSSFV